MRLRIRRHDGHGGFARFAFLCAAGAWYTVCSLPGVAAPIRSEPRTGARAAVILTQEERPRPPLVTMISAGFEHRDFAYEGRYGLREAQTVQLLGGPCTARMYQLAWEAAELLHVAPPMVAAVIEAESGCRGEAVSSAGARGLMQLIPEYGGREAYRYLHGRDRQPTQADLHDPRINIQLGVSYIGALQGHYYFVNSQLARGVLAVAAYNCGPDAVDRRLPFKRAQTWDASEAMEWVLGNTPAETRNYVGTVLRKASIYDRAIKAMHMSSERQVRTLALP